MVGLVERMLSPHEKLAAARGTSGTVIGHRIAATDRRMDRLVYELYGLAGGGDSYRRGGDGPIKLPNPERAVVSTEKLRDYCLSLEHPRGRHKARVFASALGVIADDAEELRDALLFATRTHEAVAGEQDEYGQRYVLDFEMSRPTGRARVRSSWIVRREEDFPRSTSCYVL